MNIRVLTSALEDLLMGRFFYDKQAAGLGDYFFDSLFSDIDSLALNAGIHPVHYGFFTAFFPNGSRMPSIIGLMTIILS